MYERKLSSLILRVGEFLVRLSSSSSSVLVRWEDTLGLVDPDPVRGVAEYLSQFRSSVLLSATINPSAVFARSLGLAPETVRTYEAAAEPLVVIRTAVDTGTSTRYKMRTPTMYSKIAERITAIINSTSSGVGVFARHTPSWGHFTRWSRSKLLTGTWCQRSRAFRANRPR